MPRVECKDCTKIFRKNKKNIRAMQEEVDWYNPPKSIAKAMMEMASIGFSPSGHGCGLGGEDWSISKEYKNGYIYASFCTDHSNDISVVIYDSEDNLEDYCNSRPSGIVKLAKELVKRYNKERL